VEESKHAAEHREHESHGLGGVSVIHFPLYEAEEILLSERSEILRSKVRDQVVIDMAACVHLVGVAHGDPVRFVPPTEFFVAR
jgi:hypothetical protein